MSIFPLLWQRLDISDQLCIFLMIEYHNFLTYPKAHRNQRTMLTNLLTCWFPYNLLLWFRKQVCFCIQFIFSKKAEPVYHSYIIYKARSQVFIWYRKTKRKKNVKFFKWQENIFMANKKENDNLFEFQSFYLILLFLLHNISQLFSLKYKNNSNFVSL